MRIAMIGSKGIPARSGGVERHVEAVATKLAAGGHDVLVYTRPWYIKRKLRITDYGLRITRWKGVRLIQLPSVRTKSFDAITHTFLASIDVLRRDVDVVHYHGIGPSLLLWIPKLFSRSTVVATFHCQDYHHQKWNGLARVILRVGEWMACTFADETIVVSRELERYVWAAYQRRAVYIPNGVNAIGIRNPSAKGGSAFGGQSAIRKILHRWKLQPNDYILFVGRLVRHKGVHTLIQAYSRIIRQRRIRLWRANYPAAAGPLDRGRDGKLRITGLKALPPLVIVGAGANTDDYVRELKGMAKGLSVRFLGEQTGNTLVSLMKHARLVVHPSISEGMSLSLLETMAVGTPVLTSDIPENRDVLGKSATTFHTDDVHDLQKKLRWCLTHEKAMARRAMLAKRIVLNYSWDDVTQCTRNVYENIMKIRKLRMRLRIVLEKKLSV